MFSSLRVGWEETDHQTSSEVKKRGDPKESVLDLAHSEIQSE